MNILLASLWDGGEWALLGGGIFFVCLTIAFVIFLWVIDDQYFWPIAIIPFFLGFGFVFFAFDSAETHAEVVETSRQLEERYPELDNIRVDVLGDSVVFRDGDAECEAELYREAGLSDRDDYIIMNAECDENHYVEYESEPR